MSQLRLGRSEHYTRKALPTGAALLTRSMLMSLLESREMVMLRH
jgi:hypothetical protein